MNSVQKQQWMWDDEICICQTCLSAERIERLKYEKEREFYARAKQQLYPKMEMKQKLKRIKSNEKWDGTSSFYQMWRPPSALAQFFEGLNPANRKGTGIVGNAANAGAVKDNAASEGVVGSMYDTHQLHQLDEELEMVEEESLSGSESDHGGNGHLEGTSSSRRLRV